MINIIIEADQVVQENEKFRISFGKSFLTPDEISPVTLVEVRADTSLAFIPLPNPTDSQFWYLDWVYPVAGSYTFEVQITAGLTVASKTGTVTVKTAVADKLFSKDSDLVSEEFDITNWLPQGRSTWNFIHRRAKDRIMEEMDKSRIFNVDGTKITDAQILNVNEFKNWSIYLTLAMIFQGISNNKEDVFIDKRKYYETKQLQYKEYALNFLRLDMNKNGTDEPLEDYVDARSTIALKR
jgi:hypothetical protein